ncbi:hypothetical protein CRUP_024611 [Coryphaenoides rupestris]|nr:hypothetical protein CRUP_024611 [Coryphaenoides rupestris]
MATPANVRAASAQGNRSGHNRVRGFDRPSGRGFIGLSARTVRIPAAAASPRPRSNARVRSALRERFLRCLLSTANRRVRFCMYGKVEVHATFGASDIDVLNFQVSDLQTPIGVQKEALIRCQDVISYSFDL